jgi:hypothetical protein
MDCYIRISYEPNNGSYSARPKGGFTTQYHEDFVFGSNIELTVNESIWAGKKVGCLGDSTTAMSQWYNKWAAKSGAIMTSYAISGTTIAGTSSESMC